MFISFLCMLKGRFLIALFVLLLLSGCGQPSQSASVPVSKDGQSSQNTPVPVGTSVAFDLGGWIHVQSGGGFVCSVFSSLAPGTLVLPTVLPTYDQGALQSMTNYITAVRGVTGGRSGPFIGAYPVFSANPQAFQLVAVDTASEGCWETLQITNIGNAPVQIAQISVRYIVNTQTNTQHYNLIDACSLIACFPPRGVEGTYDAPFDLHPGNANNITPATCLEDHNGCLPQALSLKPGEIAEMQLVYSSSPSSDLTFSLIPSFTLNQLGKQMTYAAPQLQATFAFASASQFSCYALQGQQFVDVSHLSPRSRLHQCI